MIYGSVSRLKKSQRRLKHQVTRNREEKLILSLKKGGEEIMSLELMSTGGALEDHLQEL